MLSGTVIPITGKKNYILFPYPGHIKYSNAYIFHYDPLSKSPSERHDIAEILLKMALNINQSFNLHLNCRKIIQFYQIRTRIK